MAKMISMRKKEAVWDKTGGQCWYCGDDLTPFNFQVDHLIPRSRGGGHELDNLVPACRSCNASKGAKSLAQFRRYHYWRSIGAPAFTDEQIEFLYRRYDILFDFESHLFWFEEVEEEELNEYFRQRIQDEEQQACQR